MSKLIKNIAFAMMVTIVFALISTTAAFAEDTVTEDNKELVLYNTDGDIDGDGTEDLWVGFRYIDEDGDTCLDITYNGKHLTDLAEEGYIIEYRGYTEIPATNDLGFTSWTNFTALNVYNYNIFYFSKTNNSNIYQFRISSSDKNIISVSDRLVLQPNVTTSPIIINSNLNNFDYYDLDGQNIKMSLKFNDNFNIQDTTILPYIDMNIRYGNEESNMITPFSATNLQYENHSENINIAGKDYTWNYCIVTFYCNFAHFELTYNKYPSTLVYYEMYLKNIAGAHYQTEPYTFLYVICSYKDTSLNPKKKVEITEDNNRLEPGETVNLTTDILSDEISKENLIWESSDESIATVDENGTVTAKSLGVAYIYVTKENTDELYDYCIINVVEDSPISNISLNAYHLPLETSSSYRLLATVEPENALDTTVTWTSSDESIATIDGNGVVTAKSAGTAVITVTSNSNTSISNSCTVEVTDPIYNVSSIKITGVPKRYKVGSKFTLKAVVSPSNATNKNVTWTSSNTKYATVSSKGVVNIKSAGAGKTVKITATAKDGSGIKKYVTLNIPKVKVTKITLKASKTTIVAGKTVQVKATINPSNATNKKVTWKSSNTKYATVNQSGLVSTKKAGKGKVVKITCTSKDNSKIKTVIKLKIK